MSTDNNQVIADRLWKVSENLLRAEPCDQVDSAIEELCGIVHQLCYPETQEQVEMPAVNAAFAH